MKTQRKYIEITPDMDLGAASPFEYEALNESKKRKNRRIILTESQVRFIMENRKGKK